MTLPTHRRVCGSCGRGPVTHRLKHGLLRCQTCFDDLAGLCLWPREERPEIGPLDLPEIERPWLAWANKATAHAREWTR